MSSEQKQADLAAQRIQNKMDEGRKKAEELYGSTTAETGAINKRVVAERTAALDQTDPVSTRIKQSANAQTRAASAAKGAQGGTLSAGEQSQIKRSAESDISDALFANKQKSLDALSGTGGALASNTLAAMGGFGALGAAASSPNAPKQSKVICNELHRQGYLSDEIIKKDEEYGAMIRREDCLVYIGYRVWADSIVKIMKKSTIVTKLVSYVALPWAKDMAGQDSKFGRIISIVGMSICREIGRVKLWKVTKRQKA